VIKEAACHVTSLKEGDEVALQQTSIAVNVRPCQHFPVGPVKRSEAHVIAPSSVSGCSGGWRAVSGWREEVDWEMPLCVVHGVSINLTFHSMSSLDKGYFATTSCVTWLSP